MARSVFVDTSCWIAVADRSERHHAKVVAIYEDFLKGSTILVTSDLVIAETQILLRRRLGYDAARLFLDGVNNSPSINLVFLDSATELAAKEILHKFSDQELSFTDATSFAIMRAAKINTAFTLDQHFAMAGFRIVPQ
jgi:predicted nucleic acid-binding protein